MSRAVKIRDPHYTFVYHIIVKEGVCNKCGKRRTQKLSDKGYIGDHEDSFTEPCSCGGIRFMEFVRRERD